MGTGVKPLASYTEAQVKHMLATAMMPSVVWPGNSSLEQFCKPLVDDCLQLDPLLRPPMTQVYEALAVVAGQHSELARLRLEWTASDQLRAWTGSAVHECLSAAPVQCRSRKVKHERRANEEQAAQITSTTRYVVMGRMPSTEEGMMTSLFNSMLQWNFALSESPCCLFHAAVAECIRVCEKLQALECQEAYMPKAHGQCLTCGLLLDDDEQC